MTHLEVEYDLVFIIDCLAQQERESERISEDLMQYLADNGIKQLQAKCNSKAMVLASLTYMKKLAGTGIKFCLQIVSHGTEDGLWIKNTNEDITWNDLREELYEVNENLGGTLMINMTTCKELNGIKIVDETKNKFPFFGLIGCYRDLYIDEGKLANKLFYTKLLEGKDISLIVSEIQQEFSNNGVNDNVIYCISSQGYSQIKKKLGKS